MLVNNEKGFTLVEILISVALSSIIFLVSFKVMDLLSKSEKSLHLSRVESVAIFDFLKLFENPSICSSTLAYKDKITPNSKINILPLISQFKSMSGEIIAEKMFEPNKFLNYGEIGRGIKFLGLNLKKYMNVKNANGEIIEEPSSSHDTFRLRKGIFELIYVKSGIKNVFEFESMIYTLKNENKEYFAGCWTGTNPMAYVCEKLLGGTYTNNKCMGMTFNTIQSGFNSATYGSYDPKSKINPYKNDSKFSNRKYYQDRGGVFIQDSLQIGLAGSDSVLNSSIATAEQISVSPGLLNPNIIQVNGPVTALEDVTASRYYYLSDRKFKDSIADVSIDDAKKILNLKTFEYNLVGDSKRNTYYGLDAEKVKQEFPEAINEQSGTLMIDYASLISPMLRIIQKQEELILEYEDTLR